MIPELTLLRQMIIETIMEAMVVIMVVDEVISWVLKTRRKSEEEKNPFQYLVNNRWKFEFTMSVDSYKQLLTAGART